jgi:hypothetical protein
MAVTTAKINDIVAARIGAARQLVGTRIMPVAAPAGRKAAAQTRQLVGERIMPTVGPAGRKAAAQARDLLDRRITPVVGPYSRKAAAQTRQLVGTRIMPAVGTAIVATAPVRGEAVRRSRLAASALRQGEFVVKKRRRWPVALFCLGLGGVLGAGAAWLAQAGKPVQLSPYPLETDDMAETTELHSMNGSHPVNLTDDSPAHHSA